METLYNLIIGPVISELIQFAKVKWGRDGKKTIFIIAWIVSASYMALQNFAGELAIQEMLRVFLEIGGSAMYYYNFIIKKDKNDTNNGQSIS